MYCGACAFLLTLSTRRREYAYSSVEFTLETQKRLTGNHAASFKGEPTQASEHALKIPVCQNSYPGPKERGVLGSNTDTHSKYCHRFSPRDLALFSPHPETMLLTSPFPYSCLTPLRTSDKLSHMPMPRFSILPAYIH